MDRQSLVLYRCPGEDHLIDRSQHLGRLANFYPACRQCPHNSDVGDLPIAHSRQLTTVHEREPAGSLFGTEGFGGVCSNQLDARAARRFGAAFGGALKQAGASAEGDGSVVLGSDGRSLTAELLAAAGEGVRLAGWRVIEIEAATAPCLANLVHQQKVRGGLYVGNAASQAHTASLSVWGPGAMDWSAGGNLDLVRQIFEGQTDREGRKSGGLARISAAEHYLPWLRERFHALRPLRMVVDTVSQPLINYLRDLTSTTACQIIRPSDARGRVQPHSVERSTTSNDFIGRRLNSVSQQVCERAAHFGAWIDGNAEVCHFVDQHGHVIGGERMLVLLAGYLRDEQSRHTVVIEPNVSNEARRRLRSLSFKVVESDSAREAMADKMCNRTALCGGGSSGRFWFGHAPPLSDALHALSLLLTLLSRTDEPLSAVLGN